MKLSKGWIFGSVFLFGVPAAALYGGGYRAGLYLGPLPSNYYADEACFTPNLSVVEELGIVEVQVNPRGVLDDGNPNTYLRCSAFANLQQLVCHVGMPDGTIATCGDSAGPPVLPGLDDRFYMVLDTNSPGPQNCDIVIEKSFGEANPACRTSGSGGASATGGSASVGGTSSTGGGSSTGGCNASTAAATLSTGQSTTVAANSCIRLTVDPTWSTVNPVIQAQPGTASYPVPFTATSCTGSSTGALTGDWNQQYLVDGSGAANNFHCDVFVKLQGTSAAVKFVYYD